jgi:hypothetical protein
VLDNIPLIAKMPSVRGQAPFSQSPAQCAKRLKKKEPVPYFSKPEAHRHVQNGCTVQRDIRCG